MTRTTLAVMSLAALSLPACGGCGDDTAADPDAALDPDAETPDAMPDLPPGPVTGLTAAPDDPAEVDLAWTNPTDADLAGVLVVVSTSVITFAPVDGTAYAAAQDLGGGQTVLAAADATAATITAAIVGTRYFVSAWAFDAATQYSTAATVVGANHALGAQTATITISLAGVVTVTSAPPGFTLSGTAVYTDAVDTLDVDLAIQNDTPRLVFNLKALTTAQNEGTQAGTLFPPVGGQPSTYYGPEALDVGATATRTLNLAGITGATDPITLTLSFVDAPMLCSGTYGQNLGCTDTAGSDEGVAVNDMTGLGTRPFRGGVISPDGRFVYTGTKTTAAVVTIDLTTLTAVAGAALGDAANGLGSVGGLTGDVTGTRLFVVITDGAHGQGGDASNTEQAPGPAPTTPDVELVELAAPALTETHRVTLVSADADERVGREIAVSPDGHTAAVLVAAAAGGFNDLWLVDLDTFTAIGAAVALPATGQACTVTWKGTDVYVGYCNHSQWLSGDVALPIAIVNATTRAVSSVAAPAGAGANASRIVFDGDTMFYASRVGTGDGLVAVDGTTVTPMGGVDESRLVLRGADRIFMVDASDNLFEFDPTSLASIDLDGNGTGVDHVFVRNSSAHFAVLTPF